MRIGFVHPEENISNGHAAGYLDAAEGASSEATGWSSWAGTVFLHYCTVQGIVAIVRDLVHFFGGR